MKDSIKIAGMALLFLLLVGLFFHDVLSGEYLLVERDLGDYFIPPRLFWVETLKQGSFPFWNPYYHSGHPLFATLQTGVFYPFSLFYLFLPFAFVFNNTIVLHFALAGIFTYLLMRAQHASHSAAFIASVCFVFGGYLMSVHNLLSTLLSVVWVPLFLLVYFSAFIQDKNPHRGDLSRANITRSIWAGGVGTVMFLGGGVEVGFLIFPLVFLISVFPGLLFEQQQYPRLKTRLLCFTIFALTFAGLSAVQLLPFMELSQRSIRAAGLSYQEATIWSLHPVDLITFFISDLYGYATGDLDKYWGNQNWLKSIYLGSMPFLLALIFFLKRERKGQAFLLLILLSFVLAFGRHSLIYPLIYKYVPFFDQLRYPVKFIFLAIFLISLSAGFGYDRFREGLQTDPEKTQQVAGRIFGIGFLAMVLFGVLNAYEEPIFKYCKEAGWDKPDYNDLYVNLFNSKRFFGFTGIFALILFLWGKARVGKPVFGALVILVLTLDLYFSTYGFYQKIKTETYLQTGSNMQFLLSDPSLSRIYISKTHLSDEERENYDKLPATLARQVNPQKEKITPGLGLNKRIFSTKLAEVTIQSRYKNIIDLILTSPNPDSTHLLNMMNVKYLVSVPVLQPPNFKLVHMSVPGNPEELEKTEAIKIYENLNVLPRALLVANCRAVGSELAYKNIFSDLEFHPERVILLDQAPDGFACDEKNLPLVAEPGESVEITGYQNNAIALRVTLHSKKFLFMSESYYPGWQATVDGKPTTIYRANYVFRALLLEPGEHVVRFEYSPMSFKIGAGISLLTIMIGASFLIRKRS